MKPTPTPRFFLIAGASGSAQSTLFGAVSDTTAKRYLDNAIVEIPSLSRSVRTNAEGIYRFDSLARGTYFVTVRVIGYSSWADSVAIDEADGTIHDFTLR